MNKITQTQIVPKQVAVVVPMSNRTDLTDDEKISFRHLVHFLGRYDKYLVVPKNWDLDFPGFQFKRFDNKFFGSSQAHRQLILSRPFYESFSDYEFILIYHLDALVFSDQLSQWCDTGLDYIGAPWIKTADAPYAGNPRFEGKVGNGGFSLRKIESFLKVIGSSKRAIEPREYWEKFYASKSNLIKCVNLPKKFLMRFSVFNNARREISSSTINDDGFLANRATYYNPDFKFASVETALRFAFEYAPRVCFEMNRYRLPFGCHAWQRYDREFWEPYLLK